MSRIRTLRLLLAVTAAAWAMIFTAVIGLIALHVVDPPRPRVVYQHVYVPAPARPVASRPVLVQTPHGLRCCCPPPPCCPRGHGVTYVPYTPQPPRAPLWPIAFLGLLGAGAIVSTIVSGRRVLPVQP